MIKKTLLAVVAVAAFAASAFAQEDGYKFTVVKDAVKVLEAKALANWVAPVKTKG
mgnify:CR=1 FL=1